MKKEVTDEQLIGLLESGQKDRLQKLIAQYPDLKQRVQDLEEVLNTIEGTQDLEVPAHIGTNIGFAIAEERRRLVQKRSFLQIAAAVAILILGFGLGRFSGGSSSELQALRGEIQSLKEVTLTSALKNYTASERLQVVSQIERSATSINSELVSALISTFNGDESPNVRYAALQALSNYVDNEEVRAQLVKSLESQKDPLIQITLITILVEAEERSVIAPLKKIIDEEETTPEVKQQAEIAIQVLT